MKWVETISKIKKSIAIKALLNMFAFFAIIHIVAAAILVVARGDLRYLNVFYIESLSEFFPGIDTGFLSFVLSSGIIACVYGYFYSKRKKK